MRTAALRRSGMNGSLGLALAGLGVALAVAASAGPADVLEAHALCNAESVCVFTVSVKHADSGWKHYANRWEVLGPGDEVLATRTLRHPHVGEQPFTRKLPRVKLPATLTTVRIRAHDLVHGYGGAEVSIELER
ncbi:MAG: hypothetical protein VCB99_07300 [Myxococcota bacterium]